MGIRSGDVSPDSPMATKRWMAMRVCRHGAANVAGRLGIGSGPRRCLRACLVSQRPGLANCCLLFVCVSNLGEGNRLSGII